MVDANRRELEHTGDRCIAMAGDQTGADSPGIDLGAGAAQRRDPVLIEIAADHDRRLVDPIRLFSLDKTFGMINNHYMIVETLAPTETFIENLGLSAEADGFPRIAGRLFALMVVEEGPFRFDDLVERLQVSRASISTNTRVLETAGIIERFTMPGERRDFFRLADDPYARMLARSLARLERVRDIVDQCREQLDPSSPSLSRLDAMSRFYLLAIENTETILSEWRRHEQIRTPHSSHTTHTTGHPA